MAPLDRQPVEIGHRHHASKVVVLINDSAVQIVCGERDHPFALHVIISHCIEFYEA